MKGVLLGGRRGDATQPARVLQHGQARKADVKWGTAAAPSQGPAEEGSSSTSYTPAGRHVRMSPSHARKAQTQTQSCRVLHEVGPSDSSRIMGPRGMPADAERRRIGLPVA